MVKIEKNDSEFVSEEVPVKDESVEFKEVKEETVATENPFLKKEPVSVKDESIESKEVKEETEIDGLGTEKPSPKEETVMKDEKEEVKRSSKKKSMKRKENIRDEAEEEDPDDDDDDETNENVEPGKVRSLKTLDMFIKSQDNSRNIIYNQDIPEVCKETPCILGVDEAGRGPVLGPMVYGIAFCPLESKEILVDLGCADSKQLTEEKRDQIFQKLNKQEKARNLVGWSVELISPNTISTSMYKRCKYSLNEISMGSAIGLINMAIDAGVNIAEVYVDTVGPPEKYQEKLKGLFPQFKIVVAKKADSTYPIVSAASICAKVTRDHALQVWQFQEGLTLKSSDFGSGYPGDPVTKRFLSENIDNLFGYPRLVRFSWSTAENALIDKAFGVEFDEPDEKKPKYAGPKLTKFFKGTTKDGEIKREPCRFFKERFLNSVVDF